MLFSAPRTCNDLKLLGVTISGDYYINPDGPFSGFPPVKVFCDVKSGRLQIPNLVWANLSSTGISFSEALILASTNTQYDKRLLIELQVLYLNLHDVYNVYINCFFVLTFRTIYVHNMC